MSELISYADWYASGRLAPYLRERRAGGDAVPMIEVGQPAGDMSDPATADMVLTQNLSDRLVLTCDFGAGRFRAKAPRNALFLSPAYVATDIVIDSPHALRVCALNAQRHAPALAEMRASAAPLDFGRLHAGHFDNRSIVQLVDRLWDVAAEPGTSTRLHAEGIALAILAELSRLADAPVVPAKGGLAPCVARRCTEYLRAHAAQEVSLAELAALADLSPFHFARMFKQTVGVPPYAYQVRARCEKAQQLLLNGDLSIIEIAAMVGYETPQAFARMFRAEVGQSPSAWRRARAHLIGKEEAPPNTRP